MSLPSTLDLSIPPAALALWENEQTRLALLMLVIAGLVFFVLPGGRRHEQRRTVARDDQEIKRPRNTALLLRLWWRVHPPTDLMVVDGLAVNRSRKPHCAWLAPTGGGKSASVATVRVDGRRPTLIVTPDVSDPMRAATLRLGGVLWTACDASSRVNFLLGTPQEVAERLTEVFRSGGTGAWKRAARMNTAVVIADMDGEGVERSLVEIGQRLKARVKADKNLALVCAGWVDRFLDLADQFGHSIGEGGLDIAELLGQGRTVCLDVDGFDHPSLGGDVVALGLAEAKRCASLVRGGFRLIFEEAGQLGERIDLADPFFRAGRRRLIAVDVLTQSEADLDEGISANLATRVYYGQELKSLQKVAADRLGLDYRELDPANMRDFTAWVSHGRIRRLVRFPKPPALPKNVHQQTVFEPQTQQTQPERIVPESVTIPFGEIDTVEVDTPEEASEPLVSGPVAMPRVYAEACVPERLRGQLVNIWLHHVFPEGLGGCYESTYRRNNRGRPGCSFDNADWTTYVLVRTLQDAVEQGLDEVETVAHMSRVRMLTSAGKLTVDHTCENEVCDRPEHLVWEDRGRNAELYHERRREMAEV